jgi:hypothetical protein
MCPALAKARMAVSTGMVAAKERILRMVRRLFIDEAVLMMGDSNEAMNQKEAIIRRWAEDASRKFVEEEERGGDQDGLEEILLCPEADRPLLPRLVSVVLLLVLEGANPRTVLLPLTSGAFHNH